MNDGMNDREIEFIPDRLIVEPVVFKGMTDSEIVKIILVSIVFWIPVNVLVLLPFGFGLFGVATGFGMAILTLLYAGKKLQVLKRRMPDGLHIIYIRKLLQKKVSFINFGYIEESKAWDIRREVPRPVKSKSMTKD